MSNFRKSTTNCTKLRLGSLECSKNQSTQGGWLSADDQITRSVELSSYKWCCPICIPFCNKSIMMCQTDMKSLTPRVVSKLQFLLIAKLGNYPYTISLLTKLVWPVPSAKQISTQNRFLRKIRAIFHVWELHLVPLPETF